MVIYKVTNIRNGMVYIGQTKNSAEARWKAHCACVNSKISAFKLHKAIKEFGKENFLVEQIDTAETKEEANEKEVFWIKHYNATENGYNTALGGRDGGHKRKVMAVESGLVFDTMVEAARFYGVNCCSIRQVVDKPHLRSVGQHWVSL